MTEKVAVIIGDALKNKGFDVDSFFVRDIDKTAVKNYECLIAGAPTMAFKVSDDMRRFLDDLPIEDLSEKLASAFDTQIKSRFSGNAAMGIESKLKGLGFKLISAPLVVYVEGKTKTNEWRIKEGELEKAKSWTEGVAEALSKYL